MTGQTHAIIGGAIGLSAEMLHPLSLSAFLPAALPNRNIAALVSGGVVLVILGVFVARLPDVDFQLRLPHRGLTHSLVAVALATVVAGALARVSIPAAALEGSVVTAAAYLSHLAADLPNSTPQALLWPLPGRQRPGWLPVVREDSWKGRVLEAIVTVVLIGVMSWRVLRLVVG